MFLGVTIFFLGGGAGSDACEQNLQLVGHNLLSLMAFDRDNFLKTAYEVDVKPSWPLVTFLPIGAFLTSSIPCSR